MTTPFFEAAAIPAIESEPPIQERSSFRSWAIGAGGTILALGGLFVSTRAANAEGEFTVAERITYGVTGQCEGKGMIPDETELIGCNAVVPGTVALVNLPGLAPVNTAQQPYTQEDLEHKAVRAEGLLNSLQGLEEYRVTAITAPDSVSQEIRNKTESYRKGWECFDDGIMHASLASWVLDEIPVTQSYEYVIAVGGDACPKIVINADGEEVLDENGEPKTTDASGTTFLNTAPREIDIYTHNAGLPSKEGRMTPSDFEQTLLHEVGHHKGLGHLGNIACRKDEYIPNIDIYEVFSPESMQKNACNVNEYAQHYNIMGTGDNADYGKNYEHVADYMTESQLDILRNQTIGNSTISLEEGDTIVFDRRPEETNGASAIYHALDDEPIILKHNPDTDEHREYSGLILSAKPGNYKSFKVGLSLVRNTAEGFSIVEADSSSTQIVTKGDYNTVIVGNTKYLFQSNEAGTSLQVSRMPTVAP